MIPTQEQIKEFWEWCGIAPNYCDNWANGYPCYDSLDHLFKYAVPKVSPEEIVFDGYDEWFCHLHICDKPRRFMDFLGKPPKTHCITESDTDPALALFWALWQVKG